MNSKYNKTNTYQLSSVIAGIHYHRKYYQHFLLFANLLIVVVVILVIVLSELSSKRDTIVSYEGYYYFTSSGNHTAINTPQSSLPVMGDMLSSQPKEFLSGYKPNIKIIKERYIPLISPVEYSGPSSQEITIPDDIETMESIVEEPALPDYLMTSDTIFYLPPRKRLWEYTTPAVPSENTNHNNTLSEQPRLILANIYIPEEKVMLLRDTAVVVGYLILHKSGRVSFVDIYESQPSKSFADDIRKSLRYSYCYPAKDSTGKAIDIKVKYKCLIVNGGRPTVHIIPQNKSFAVHAEKYELKLIHK